MNGDIIAALKEFGEIEYWTKTPASDGGDFRCPPVVAWRYHRPDRVVQDRLERTIAAYPGQIAWELRIGARLWSLMPRQVADYGRTQGIGGLAAASAFMCNEPEFGRRANAELPLLAAHIREQCEMRRPRDQAG